MTTVPGIGPIIASAMVAAIGNGVAAFAKGHDFAAWLGLAWLGLAWCRSKCRPVIDDPGADQQHGNCYLRTLFMQGAPVGTPTPH